VSDLGILSEADRQFTICNACRFCEGICAVFPAMELRTAFTDGDVSYLANLCHDCGACLEACPFSDPHEFAIDIPALMSEARAESYERFAWPRGAWALFTRRGVPSAIFAGGLVFFAVVALATGGHDALFQTHTGPNAFYSVVPFPWILVPAGLASVYALAAMLIGVWGFARQTGAGVRPLLSPTAHRGAAVDALRLRYLKGGGGGCPYPVKHASAARRLLHACVFYGFLCTFASTVVAAFEQDILGIRPPFPILSAPVVLGTIGGVGIVAGGAGFMVVGRRRERARTTDGMLRLNRAFTTLLLAAALTGLLVLAFRATPLMGSLLILHLGVLAALFVTFPYGKFVHWLYRYAALVQFRIESGGDSPSRTASERLGAQPSPLRTPAVPGLEVAQYPERDSSPS
jgi:citrate/tricarballylate utilization protein